MNALVAAPIVVPLVAAALGLAAWRKPRVQAGLGVLGAGGILALGVALLARVHDGAVLVTAAGGWPAPFGIVLVADATSAILVALTGFIGLTTLAYASGSLPERYARRGFHPLSQVLLAGVCGAFLTGDLFDLYVWFEVILLASFVLVVAGGTREQLDGGLKYVALSLVGSVLFLTALGLTYGLAGTLNMADLSLVLAERPPATVLPIAALLLLAFGLKAGVVPLAFWLPAAYPTPPPAVSALFAGLLTKVGVYALFRVVTLVLPSLVGLDVVLTAVAIASMLAGVLGAVAHSDVRRILAFHSISQVGYMVMALALGSPLALAAGLAFLVHHAIVKGGLFLTAGLVKRAGGSFQLAELGGLSEARPGLASLFLVLALSLAGLPPLSGFWVKLGLLVAGVDLGAWALVATALLAGLLTLFSMTKIFAKAFWRPVHEEGLLADALRPDRAHVLAGSTLVLALATVGLGLGFEALVSLGLTAGEQLADPTPYVEAVLEGSP